MHDSPAKILVVDDSVSIVNSLSKILQFHGFVTDSAHNGTDALGKLHQNSYELVICDIEMPGLSGLDFLERLQKDESKDIDVILMTGYLDQDYFIKAIRLGAADFISKPVDSNMMLHSIRRLIEMRRAKTGLSDYYKHIESTRLNLVITPLEFPNLSLSHVVSSFINRKFDIPQKLLSEILVCVDEMAYNAFIHGTLQLSREQRHLCQDKLKEIIDEKLTDPLMAAKRIRFELEILGTEHKVKLSMEDDGNGFDYESWVQKVQDEPKLNVDETGRGISLLYHFSDHLSFSKGGRRIELHKDLRLGSFTSNDPS